MSGVLFRCSSLGKLMTQPKTKAAQEAGELSETSKTYVREVWLQNTYDYKEKVITDEMLKGNMVEQDSMQLYQEVTGSSLILKNTETKRNDYFIGTADIVLPDIVPDLKSSWSLRTFMDCEPTKDNEYQIKGYMDLWGKKKGQIAYCLVPTPDILIQEQIKRFYFKFNCDLDNPHYIEISEQIEKNNDIILSIPKEQRVKIFEYDYDKNEIQLMYNQVEKARIYYNSLKL